MQNTIYNSEYEKKEFSNFFQYYFWMATRLTSKLLTFMTKSSIIPFLSFKNLENNGGLFTFERYFYKKIIIFAILIPNIVNKIHIKNFFYLINSGWIFTYSP